MPGTDVLIVGGGIAGIESALVLAGAGRSVCLVERQPTLGGHMAKLQRIFPTLDDAVRMLAPRMQAVRTHPNITVRMCSEVTAVEGEAGNYRVALTRHPRYVTEDRCTGCLDCIDACVYDARFPDPFNLGLVWRKPIYLPFPHAVPRVAVIDRETCSGFSGGCDRPCVAACGERGAIDLSQAEHVTTVAARAIVLATGFRAFDVSRVPSYGYGTYPNVYTSLEVEHLLGRPNEPGGAITLRDGQVPRAVAIIHCVGSRDVATNRWCSRVCCMGSLKLAHLLSERTGADVFNFYVDMRTPGAAFEEFYQQRLNEGVHLVRGRVAEVTDWALDPSEEGKLVIRVEDTLLGVVRRVPVDMVVLAAGLEPQADAQAVARLFGVECSADGFFVDPHPALGINPASASAKASTSAKASADESADKKAGSHNGGAIFVAGCCEGPKDLRDTVIQAEAAAARVLALIDGFPTCPVSR